MWRLWKQWWIHKKYSKATRTDDKYVNNNRKDNSQCTLRKRKLSIKEIANQRLDLSWVREESQLIQVGGVLCIHQLCQRVFGCLGAAATRSTTFLVRNYGNGGIGVRLAQQAAWRGQVWNIQDCIGLFLCCCCCCYYCRLLLLLVLPLLLLLHTRSTFSVLSSIAYNAHHGFIRKASRVISSADAGEEPQLLHGKDMTLFNYKMVLTLIPQTMLSLARKLKQKVSLARGGWRGIGEKFSFETLSFVCWILN